MNSDIKHDDWTAGVEGIVFQSCGECAFAWYFHRDFCPNCGAKEPVSSSAKGSGTVYAVTTVNRAPSRELQAYVPYRIVLVKLDEGIQMMGHGADEVGIGDKVQARYISFCDTLVPYFERVFF